MPKRICELIRLARNEAGMSQEAAAPHLYLSLKQLKRLESGAAEPDPATIGRMAKLYMKPLLGAQYVAACAESAGVPGLVVHQQSLPVAALQLINAIYRFADSHKDRRLLQIAEDGVISPEEQEDFSEIMTELLSISQSARGLLYATEQEA